MREGRREGAAPRAANFGVMAQWTRRALVGAAALAVGAVGLAPATASAARSSDYPDQAAAQRAADTRDADGDGIYCESLPCPCSTRRAQSAPPRRRSCTRPATVQHVVFSATRYPNVFAHMRRAISAGWPRTLVLHRRRSGVRRDRALDGFPIRRGYDRDEYPPAVGREDWHTSVAYVPSAENRSHGASLGAQLRPFCAGTRFRYVFR